MLLIERELSPELIHLGKVNLEVKANIVLGEKDASIHLFVPGYSKEQISLRIESNLIIIEGKVVETQLQQKNVRREFLNSNFKRSFEVSKKYNMELVSAKLEDGILKIRIPKNEISNKIKQITIH